MKKTVFNKLIELLWTNRKIHQSQPDVLFDFPDYGKLKKEIWKTLSPEAVDAIQYIWHDFLFSIKRRREFAAKFRKRLKELGEGVY